MKKRNTKRKQIPSKIKWIKKKQNKNNKKQSLFFHLKIIGIRGNEDHLNPQSLSIHVLSKQ